jgi:DNA-binding transcriptional LysR family regulator
MLLQKLEQREIDVVFSYENDEKKYRSYPVFAERMVVAMHKSFLTPALIPYAITRGELLDLSYDREKEKIDTRLFLDIPFLSFDKSGSAVHYMANILKHYTLSKHSVINAKHSGVHFNMMRAGVGAILTSDSVIRAHNACLDDIVYFAFPEEISTRRIYATLRNNEVVNEPLKHFLEVVKEVCASEKSLSLYL